MANTRSQSRPSRGTGSVGSSPTSGFDKMGSQHNAFGQPLPLVLGEHRVDGQLIQEDTKKDGENEVFKGAYVFAQGPISSIENILIEGKPPSKYETLELNVQTGNNNNPIPFINRNLVERQIVGEFLPDSNYPANPEDPKIYSTNRDINKGDYATFVMEFPDGLYKNNLFFLGGDIVVSSVDAKLKIESKRSDGSWYEEDTVRVGIEDQGKELMWRKPNRPRPLRFDVPIRIENGDWAASREVRIRRVWWAWQDLDNVDTLFKITQDKTRAEVKQVKWEVPNTYSYPDCAVVGLKINKEEIGTDSPQISALIKGLGTTSTTVTIDGFEDGDISEYSEGNIVSSGNISWSVQTSTVQNGSNALKASHTGNEGMFTEDLLTGSIGNKPTMGDTFTGWLRVEQTDAKAGWSWVVFGADNDKDDYYRFGLKVTDGTEEIRLEKMRSNNVKKSSFTGFANGQGFDNWYKYEIDWKGGNIIGTIFDSGGAEIDTVEINDSEYKDGDWGFAAGAVANDQTTVDDFSDGDLTEYTDAGLGNDVDTWTVNASNEIEGTHDNTNNGLANGIKNTNSNIGKGTTLELDIRPDINNTGDLINTKWIFFFGLQNDDARNRAIIEQPDASDDTKRKLTADVRDGNGGNTVTDSSINFDQPTGEFTHVIIDWQDTITVTAEDPDGNQLAQVSVSDQGHDSTNYGFNISSNWDLSQPNSVTGQFDNLTAGTSGASVDLSLYFDNHNNGQSTWTQERVPLIEKVGKLAENNGGFGMASGVFDSSNINNVQSHLNEDVKDGQGGTETRDLCNMVVDQEWTWQTFIDQMTVIPQLGWFGDEGGIRFYADKSGKSAQKLFTDAVIEKENGRSTLQVQPKKREQQFNSLSLEFNHQANEYRKEIETVQLDSANSKRPQKKEQMYSVTRRTQIKRDAELKLRTMNDEDYNLSFTADTFAIDLQPGDVCWISHDLIPSTTDSLSDMVKDFGTDWLATDREFTMTAGNTYELAVMLEDGTVKKVSIDNEEKTTNIFNLSFDKWSDFSGDPLLRGPASVGIQGEVKQDIRIQSITENADGEIDVEATQHDEAKYTDVDDITFEQNESTKERSDITPKPVRNLDAEDTLDKGEETFDGGTLVSWDPPLNSEKVQQYRVWVGEGVDNQIKDEYNLVAETSRTSYTVESAIEGANNSFVVQTEMVDGQILDFRESPEIGSTSTGQRGKRPDDITGLSIEEKTDALVLTWDKLSTTFEDYEVRLGKSWEFARVLDSVTEAKYTYEERQTNTKYHFLVAATNTEDVSSKSPDHQTITLTSISPENEIYSKDEQDASWPGTLTNCQTTTKNGESVIVPDHNISGSKVETFTYESQEIDISKDFDPKTNILWNLNIPTRNGPQWGDTATSSETWADAAPGKPYTWDYYNRHIDGADIKYKVKPDGGSYSSYKDFTGPFDNETYRYITFKITVNVMSRDDEIWLRQFHPLITAREVRLDKNTDSSLDQKSFTSSGDTITYSNFTDQKGESGEYYDPPDIVNIDNFSDNSVERAKITNKTRDSVDIQLLDSSDSGVAASADVRIVGI